MSNIHRSTQGRLACVALLAVLLGGCDSFLDVNDDPNAPVNARVEVRLPAMVGGVIHSVYYGDPPLWGVEWVQQTSYDQATRYYDEIQLYEVQDNAPDGWWDFYYAQILNEAKLMMEETDSPDDVHYHGLAKFLWAWTWALTTDLWGPIPFTEALDPEIPAPRYDSQRVVYDAVLQWFDEAVDEMRNPASLHTPGAGDLLFGGDMARWVKLARVVQARHELRLAYRPGENAQQRAQAALDALAEGFTSNADDADFAYPGGEGARNPLWLFQDRGDLFKASALTVDMLKERNDPRLPILVMPALWDGEYRGHLNGGEVEPDSSISRVGDHFTAENATLNVASYADARFNEAEARLILSGAAAADAPYRAGIRANMEKLGVASADVNAYLAARPPLSSLANPLAEIIREKYLANYLKIEPWNDWRRTGYPEIDPVPGAMISGIPLRIRTPQSELANNAVSVAQSGVSTGLDGMLYKSNDVWWGAHQ